MAVHHAVGISRQRNSGYRPNRVNIMAQGLSTPDPSVNPTHLSIRGGRATATHYTHHADIHLNIVCYIASEISFRIMILLFAFSNTPKMQFSETKLSVLNPMNSLQSNHGYMVFKMSTVTVSVHILSQSSTLLITILF